MRNVRQAQNVQSLTTSNEQRNNDSLRSPEQTTSCSSSSLCGVSVVDNVIEKSRSAVGDCESVKGLVGESGEVTGYDSCGKEADVLETVG